MPNQILRRRGTAAAHTSFTGGSGEITIDTTSFFSVLHDSSTVGGFIQPKMASTVRAFTAGGIVWVDTTTTLNNTAALTGILKGNGTLAPSAVTGATNRVTFWSDANTISSDANLSWSGSLLTIGGEVAVTRNSTNAVLDVTVTNTNAGNGARARSLLTNGTATAGMQLFGTGHSTSGAQLANRLQIDNDGVGGVAITTSNAAGTISFWGGSTVLGWTITAANILQSNGAQTISTSSGILTVTGTGGLTLTSGTSNTLLTQNSVNVFTSEGSGAIVNTLYLKAGNVGIGTTAPGSYDSESNDLVVFNAATPGITIATSDTTSRGALRFADGTTDSETYRGGIEYDHGTGSGGTADSMHFRTAAALRMSINSSGYVGIGTTAPDRVLEINSVTGINLRLTYNDANGSAANYADLLTTSAGGLTLIPSGNLINIGGGTTATQLRFLEPSGSGTNYSSFKAVAQAADINYSLPPTVGAAGTQLTDAAGDGVLTWAAAASTRKAKNIISKFSDSKKALEKVLGVSVYNFKYKKGYGTGDNDTEYTGIMADEAPWAMHFKEEILNPVNTFGYTVLSIQELNKKIEKLERLISELLSKK